MSVQVGFWLFVLIATLIVEIITMGLTSVWFSGGALVAALIAAMHGPVWLQGVAFFAVSLALLAITRPIAVKYFNKERLRTNAESLVGERGIVTGEIDNLKAMGQVTIKGQDWTARTESDGQVIPEGTIVSVVSISGVKLIVKVDDSVADHIPHIQSDSLLDPKYIEDDE